MIEKKRKNISMVIMYSLNRNRNEKKEKKEKKDDDTTNYINHQERN